MKYTVPDKPLTDDNMRAMGEEYKLFIEQLQARWLRDNNKPRNIYALYETDPREQERVHGVMRRLEHYVTPIAEAWWRRRGFGIIWPEKPNDNCQVYRLDEAKAV